MNLRDYITAIEAGGPGSGCHGDNCGRPAGHSGRHIPEGGKKSFVEQRHDEKLKQKAFNKERRRINKIVREGVPHKDAGKLLRKEVKELKKAGQIVDMKSPGLKLKTEIARVTSTRIEKIKVQYEGPRGGKKSYVAKVEVETVRMRGGPDTPRMGKTKGKNVTEGPPGRTHTLYGKFVQTMPPHFEAGRQFYAYEAESGVGPGHGASVFVNKETTGNKSRVQIQEVKRSTHAYIEETNTYKFKSGKAAKGFLQQRYGIKDIRWTGLHGDEK